MEGRVSGGGGCCIARYGHHHGPTHYNYYNPYDESKMDRIMLRFRPIAPKPVPNGSTNTTTTTADKKEDGRKGKKRGGANISGGGKRRTKSRSPEDVSKNNNNNNNNVKKLSDVVSSNGYKVTLPLLPETPDLSPRKEKIHQVGHAKSPEPMWLCFGPSDQNNNQTAVDAVTSSVIVEGVTDTWMDGNSLGRTDEERRRRLDGDTCPGFISDAWNRVCWTNRAYKRMVSGDDDTWGKEKVVTVKLGMREKVELPPVNLFPAFTCRVKVVGYGKQGMINGGHSLTVPCDAWRMDGGGFAWRLDTKAALCLGR
ncbi:uncharacterized protein LOC110724232 [Chenopodium quinoa]|uniref:uncharacterized protein LOC110724232 n=1 Tax=Chenopodium quinoa TaxID=63459 RepID=UPI000B77D163|nr:uncharacterized protein LOC110724232 [Chenopodium quinoa]